MLKEKIGSFLFQMLKQFAQMYAVIDVDLWYQLAQSSMSMNCKKLQYSTKTTWSLSDGDIFSASATWEMLKRSQQFIVNIFREMLGLVITFLIYSNEI